MKSKIYQSKKAGRIKIRTAEHDEVTIVSQRLEMKSLNQSDVSSLKIQYAQLLGKPENTRLFDNGDVWDESRVHGFINEETQLWNSSKGFGVFSIYNHTSQEFMGCLFVKKADDNYAHIGDGHGNAAEIGYIIDHKFGRQGYGTEAAVMGIKYIKYLSATLEKPVEQIVATVHPANEGSRKILQRTLKNQDSVEFAKYGNPRILFFKPLNPDNDADAVLKDTVNPRSFGQA